MSQTDETETNELLEDIKELFQALYIAQVGLRPVTSSSALYQNHGGIAMQAFTQHDLSLRGGHIPKYEDEAQAMLFVEYTLNKFSAKYPGFLPDLNFMQHYNGYEKTALDSADKGRDKTYNAKVVEQLLRDVSKSEES